ncbi:DUF2236 domain-containing protein [Humibacter sp. BT305]|nr:DUF2236 domain-containing protein [Humibacter sp. BT305]
MSTGYSPGMRSLADIAPEGILLAGAGRAILLQIADPAVGRGVAAHSHFVAHPMRRLTATLSYIYALSNGDAEDVAAVRRAVNRAHAPVRSAPGETPAYDAFDPESQLWVTATLYDSAVSLWERVFGALGDAEAERVYREYAVLGTTLQMPEGLWPATRADFAVYWADRLERLEVGRDARRVSDALLTARNAPAPVRAAMPLVRFVTAGLLPDRLRAPYGFQWTDRRQRRFDRLIDGIAPVYRALPTAVRQLPERRYLAGLRRDREWRPGHAARATAPTSGPHAARSRSDARTPR